MKHPQSDGRGPSREPFRKSDLSPERKRLVERMQGVAHTPRELPPPSAGRESEQSACFSEGRSRQGSTLKQGGTRVQPLQPEWRWASDLALRACAR